MTVEWKTYTTVPGDTYFDASELAGVTVLRVIREGLGYNRKRSGFIGDRGFRHTPASGRLEFLNPFIGYTVDMGSYDLVVGEKVYVRYKY